MAAIHLVGTFISDLPPYCNWDAAQHCQACALARAATGRHPLSSLFAPCSLTCFTTQLCASDLDLPCSCLKTCQPWPAAGKRRKVTRETYNDKGEEVTEEVWEDADEPGQGDAQAAPASDGSGALAATPSQSKAAAEGSTKGKQGGLGGATACAWQCRFATSIKFVVCSVPKVLKSVHGNVCLSKLCKYCICREPCQTCSKGCATQH